MSKIPGLDCLGFEERILRRNFRAAFIMESIDQIGFGKIKDVLHSMKAAEEAIWPPAEGEKE